MFVDDGSGGLTIVGINWFTLAEANDPQNEGASAFSYVGNYDAEIQSFIEANPVPEPATFTLLIGLSSLFFVQVGRRSRVG